MKAEVAPQADATPRPSRVVSRSHIIWHDLSISRATNNDATKKTRSLDFSLG
jgi:hypothetical protein